MHPPATFMPAAQRGQVARVPRHRHGEATQKIVWQTIEPRFGVASRSSHTSTRRGSSSDRVLVHLACFLFAS